MTTEQKVRDQRVRVLIADDDSGLVRFLANRCTQLGFDVQTAANGLNALLLAGRTHPDVLIIDIHMPEVDGLTAASRLMESDHKPKGVIVITASSSPDTSRICEGLGAYQVRKGVELWNGVLSALQAMFPDMTLETKNEKVPQPSMKWKLPRILLVDGRREAALLLSNKLIKLGIEPLLAREPVEALQFAAKEEPRVIILNFPMLWGDPYYFIAQLRTLAKTRATPIFVTSARRLDDTIEANLRREVGGQPGATHFLLKSFGDLELLGALQKYCAFMPSAASHSESPTTQL
jgi:CheY-like chemotaxis protein